MATQRDAAGNLTSTGRVPHWCLRPRFIVPFALAPKIILSEGHSRFPMAKPLLLLENGFTWTIVCYFNVITLICYVTWMSSNIKRWRFYVLKIYATLLYKAAADTRFTMQSQKIEHTGISTKNLSKFTCYESYQYLLCDWSRSQKLVGFSAQV